MNNYLDHYCERIDPASWGEPFNIYSNAAFLIVAVLLALKIFSSLTTAKRHVTDLWLLTALIFLIGIGSAAWHVLAVHWALWADRIPILVFISLFILSCLIRALDLPTIKTLLVFVIYHVVNFFILSIFPPFTLNGSLFYVPTGALLFIITFIFWRNNEAPITRYFLSGSVLFFLAITFRTIDLEVCESISVGTHFIWHILIATTIYVLMSGLIISVKNKIQTDTPGGK